jgi:WD40 repeat protein
MLPPSTSNPAYVGDWSSDGRFFALDRDAGGGRADLEVWDVGRTQALFTLHRDLPYGVFAFHPNAPQLMVGRNSGRMTAWDLASGEEQTFYLPATAESVAYAPSGDRFAVCYERSTNWVVAVHDISGQLLGLAACPEPVVLIAWHPRGHELAILGKQTSDWGRGVWLLSLDTGTLSMLGKHKIRASYVSFSPDGNYLMSCGWDQELLCWDLRTQQRVFTFSGAGYGLYWSSDGRHCATIPKPGRLKVFVFEPPLCVELSGNHGERVDPGEFSPDGRFFAAADSQNLCVWDLSCSSRPAVLNTEKSPTLPFFATNSFQLFAASGRHSEPQIQAWQIELGSTAEPPRLRPLPIPLTSSLYWAGLAGTNLVLTTEEGVRFIPQSNLCCTNCCLVKIPPGQGTVSLDGQWLGVTYRFSPWVTVYHLPEVTQVARFATSQFVIGLWFSPAGDELTVINRAGVEQWDTATWRLKSRQPGSPVSDSYIIYTPDGTGVWRVTNFRDTGLFNRNSMKPILPLPPNVIPLAVSHDGRHLAVSVDDQRVQIWDLTQLREQLRSMSLDWRGP